MIQSYKMKQEFVWLVLNNFTILISNQWMLNLYFLSSYKKDCDYALLTLQQTDGCMILMHGITLFNK